jgi:hypothetical protein
MGADSQRAGRPERPAARDARRRYRGRIGAADCPAVNPQLTIMAMALAVAQSAARDAGAGAAGAGAAGAT